MKEKMKLHIIAVTAFVVFIVLGLACATSDAPRIMPIGFGVKNLYGTWISTDKRKIFSITESEIITLILDANGNAAALHTASIVSFNRWATGIEFFFIDNNEINNEYKGKKHPSVYNFCPLDEKTMEVHNITFTRTDEISIDDLTKDVKWATVHQSRGVNITKIDYINYDFMSTVKIAEGRHILVIEVKLIGAEQKGELTYNFRGGERYVLEGYPVLIFRKYNDSRPLLIL